MKKALTIVVAALSLSSCTDVKSKLEGLFKSKADKKACDNIKGWPFYGGRSFYGTPSIGPDGTIYAGGLDSCLYAIDPEGQIKWLFRASDFITQSALVANDSTIMFVSCDGYINCLNQEGRLRWRDMIGAPLLADLALGPDGTVYFDYERMLYAVDQTGAVKWVYEAEGDDYPGSFSSNMKGPVIGGDGTIYYSPMVTDLIAVDPWGRKKWRFKVQGQVGNNPAIGDDGSIILGTDKGIVYSISPAGAENWHVVINEHITTEPVIGPDGAIYVGDASGKLTAISGGGEVLWRSTPGPNMASTPLVNSDNCIFYCTKDGYLVKLDSKGRQLERKFIAGESQHGAAMGHNGVLYVGLGYAIIAVKVGGQLPDNGWPMSRQNPMSTARAALSAGTARLPPPPPPAAPEAVTYDRESTESPLLWCCQLDGMIWSSPAVAPDGSIIVTTRNSKTYSVSPSGKINWVFPAGTHIYGSPSVAPDGSIYFGSPNGMFYALNDRGEKKWEYQTGDKIQSTPAIDEDGNVYFTSQDNYCYSLTNEGRLRWKFQIDQDPANKSPTQHENRGSVLVVNGGDIYFGAGNGNIYCLSKKGVLKWTYPLMSSVHPTPIMDDDGNLYVGEHRNEGFHSLDRNRNLRWKAFTCMAIAPPVLGGDGTMYVTSMHGIVKAVAPDGSDLWEYTAEGKVFSAPAVDERSNVYFGACDGFFYMLGPDGKMVWRYKTDNDIRSSPVITSDGTIYIGCEDGTLYAFRGKHPPAISACPMFNRDPAHTGLYRLTRYLPPK